MASVAKPCRKCGVIFVGRYCKPCDNARSAEKYKSNPGSVAARAIEWNKKNLDRRREIVQRSNKKNASTISDYRSSIASKILSYKRKYKRHQTEQLSDVYIREFFRGIPKSLIPVELLDAKRVQLKIKRAIKEKL